MRIPRFLVRIYAFMFGYFWEQCPRCGKMFAGFEGNFTIYTHFDERGMVTQGLSACCPEKAISEDL